MQPVPVSDLWDQLEFLVTKRLGVDSLSRFPLIKDKNSLFAPFSRLPQTYIDEVEYRRDVAHVRQV